MSSVAIHKEAYELWDYLTSEEQDEVVHILSSYEVFQLRYEFDPKGFILNCMEWDGEKPAPYQLEIAAKLISQGRVAVRGPHGLGKTALVALIVLWFALTRDGKDWKVPTTASVWRQLDKFLWPEIRKWARKIKWDVVGRKPFSDSELLTLNIKLSTGEAFALASNKPESLEGAHADHILYIFDEARSIIDATFDSAEGAFSSIGLENKEVYAIAISTPGDTNGRFYDIHQRKKGYEDWWVRHVTKEEAIAAGRVSPQWCEARREQWGEESAVYQNRVEGQFAASSGETIIPLAWVEMAVHRWYAWKDNGGHLGQFTGIGVDFGQGAISGDPSVHAHCYDDTIISELRKYPRGNPDTALMEQAGYIKSVLDSKGGEAVVDGIGIGAGVVHRLNEQGLKDQVKAFIASRKSSARDESGELGFANLRAAAWWNIRERLAPDSGYDIMLPDDDELIGDLTTPKKKMTSTGRYLVESKDAIKKRLKRSTNCGDAVVQILSKHLVGARFVRGYHGLA